MAAGEPIPDHPNYSETKFYERNQMAKHYVKAGFAAFVFDNPGIGETAIRTDPSSGETQWATRTALCHGYLEMGLTYPGVSVFQKLRFLDHLSNLDYVDGTRIAASGHSLGTETAIMLGLLSDRISAIVFNDNLCDEQRRYTAITEEDERHMTQNPGNWHLIPGRMTAFSFPELCAAFAPRPLALTEGGADEFIGRVRRVYEAFGVPDNLFVSHYPRYQDPATRTFHGRVPDRALTFEQYYYECCYCDAPDHSFRASPAIEFLKKRFSL